MRHGAGQTAGGIAGQLGIGVESDDIFDGREDGGLTGDLTKALPGTSAQEIIEFREFAPLAFIAHPDAFAFVPPARPVKQEKQRRAVSGILPVQLFDPLPGPFQQGSVFRSDLGQGITEIRQQGKMKMGVPVGEMMDFQTPDQAVDLIQAGQHGGHHHHGPVLGRNAFRKIQAGQPVRFYQQGAQPVHQGHRQLAGADQENEGKTNVHPGSPLHRPRLMQKSNRCNEGDHPDPARIKRQGVGLDAPVDQGVPQPSGLHRLLQHGLPFVDQIVSHVGGPVPRGGGQGPGGCQLDGFPRDLRLQQFAVPGQGFDGMAIAVPRGKIHRRVDSGGILPQDGIHPAQVLHKLLPIDRTQETETGDAVADRDLVGRLQLTLLLDQFLDGRANFSQPLLQPAAGKMQQRTVAGQTLAELGHKRAGEGQLRFRHIGHHHHQIRRAVFRHLLETVHPLVGLIPVCIRRHQPGGDPLEIFDQTQTHHDRNGPQLPQSQGSHLLIGRDKGPERLLIHLRIDVAHQFEDDVINAGQSRGAGIDEAGQFPAVAPGQMPPGHLDLFLNQVKVIDQPFRGRGDAPVLVPGGGRLIECPDDVLIRGQVGQQLIGFQPLLRPVRGCQLACMGGQLFMGEEAGTERSPAPDGPCPTGA